MKSIRLLFLLCLIGLLQACHKQDPEPTLTLKSGGLFTYRVVVEGDGLISFVADSTQSINEFTWEFGDGTAPVTTSMSKVTHTFAKNRAYSVKLTAKNGSSQISDTKAVTVDTRLARTFADVPQDQRSKLRVLHVIIGNDGYFNPQGLIQKDPINYLNTLYQDFISHHRLSHVTELNNLSFEHYFYKLNSIDSAYFGSNKDYFDLQSSSNFINEIPLSDNHRVVLNNILNEKKRTASSIVAFWIPYTYTSFDGYATGIGAGHRLVISKLFKDKEPHGYHSVCLTTLAHELGHLLGMPHDSVASQNANYLMRGSGTKYHAPLLYYRSYGLPLFFQVKEYEQSGTIILQSSKGTTYDGVPIDASGGLYPSFLPFPTLSGSDKKGTDVKIRGDMTSGGTTFFPALEDHIIEQYNIKLAPSKVTSFEKKVPRNGRVEIDENTERKPIVCSFK